MWLLEKQPFESFAKFSDNFQDFTSFGKTLKKLNANFGKILRKKKIWWKYLSFEKSHGLFTFNDIPFNSMHFLLLLAVHELHGWRGTSKASYTQACRMVCEPLANSLWTKCEYVWMGLRTCAAPSANGSHTVCRKLKFVGFWANTKRTGCAECPFHAQDVLCSLQVCRTLINRASLTRRTRLVQCVKSALVYTKLKTVTKVSIYR